MRLQLVMSLAAALAASGCSGNLECGRGVCVKQQPTTPQDNEDAQTGTDAIFTPQTDAALDSDGGLLLDGSTDADGDGGLLTDAVADALPPTEAELCGDTTGAMGKTVDWASLHCYVLWGGVLNGTSARQDCMMRGGYLASITSAAEDAIVKALILPTAQRTWIGLMRPKEGDPFVWVNGEPLGYTNWTSGQPGGKDQLCGLYDPSGTNAGWHDFDCASTARFICERQSVVPTPGLDGGVPLGDAGPTPL